MKVIVYTPHKGGVAVCYPALECIRAMGMGGYWSEFPRGFLEVQIERNIAAGHLPDASARFCRALAFGGCSEAEALAAIRDRDCAHLGTGIELWDIADLPQDRTYRDAWRRSSNGGPIIIDERKAMAIDEEHAWKFYEGQQWR